MANTTLIQANTLYIPLPDKYIHCMVTSPPYWNLRKYSGMFDLDWPAMKYLPMTGMPYAIEVEAWKGELGLEPTVEAFIGHMVLVYDELWRVLRDDGTMWMNMGDTYAGSGQGWCKDKSTTYSRRWLDEWGRKAPPGYTSNVTKVGQLKKKDAIGIPWRLALALQARGWWLRSDVIWHKRNPMPESVRDRPARAHEYLFLLTKKHKYYYDHVAVRQPAKYGKRKWAKDVKGMYASGTTGKRVKGQIKGQEINPTHNLLSVWTLSTEPYAGAHFATYPQKLVEPCILAGTSAKGCCPECGASWKRIVRSSAKYAKLKKEMLGKTHRRPEDEDEEGKNAGWGCRKPRISAEFETAGWEPTCECGPTKATEYNPERMEQLDASSRTRRLNARVKQARDAGAVHDLAMTPRFETLEWVPTCDCAGSLEANMVVCPKCKGTGKETKYRPGERSHTIGTEFSRQPTASGGVMNYEPEETGNPCPICGGEGLVEGETWPEEKESWPVVPCRVMDPFAGSGTTLLVARKLNRDGIGLDLSHTYLVEQARKRLEKPTQIKLL